MLSAVGQLGGGLLAAAAALGIAACGSSSGSSASGSSGASGSPRTLVQQAFSSSHAVKSGKLGLDLSVALTGSDEVTKPISLSFDGPFSDSTSSSSQSAFRVALKALGHAFNFGLTTTSGNDFLTLEGTSYKLPASAVGSLGATSKGSLPGLSSLGIDPARWLTDPRIVSTPTVGGVKVDRLSAGVNVPAFIKDLNTLLAKEVSSSSAARSAGVPSSISAATAKKIEAKVKHPTVQLEIGQSDALVRELVLHLTIPISGTTSTELGGATSAAVTLTTRYSDLNQPQTITAPVHPRSYSQLKSRLDALAEDLEGTVAQGKGSSASTTTPSAATVTSPSASAKYTQCIDDAKGDVAKMQKCAALVDSGQ